jgi:hypothetical protein
MSGFNTAKFQKQQFVFRTEKVPVPNLRDWFDEGCEPEWEIRNLNSRELSLSQESQAKTKNLSVALEAISTAAGDDKLEALLKIMGISTDNPAELTRRLDMLVYGSINPVMTLDVAVKLADNFPFEFMKITSQIIVLTGLGASAVKPRPSGKTPA